MSTIKGRAAMFALWFLPEWLVRWMPPSFTEAVEREVYDGLTRHEWFEKSVAELHDAARRASQRQSPASEKGKER